MKLAKRFYGPYKVIGKRSDVTYIIELPPTSKLHPVFHVSLVKKRVGDPSLIIEELYIFDEEGKMLLQPKEALSTIFTRGEDVEGSTCRVGWHAT